MTKKINFNSNGVGQANGHFIGLPFEEDEAKLVFVSVPWDVTVSYGEGTSSAPDNILDASLQLDLFDLNAPDAWQEGIYMRPSEQMWINRNQNLREKAVALIDYIERGGAIASSSDHQKALNEINEGCELLHKHVEEECLQLIDQGKHVAVVGGDHSVSLGLMQALAAHHRFGVLQIDAHMDLREAYEGFEYSHASAFFNALKIDALERLVQVGIRDFCHEEFQMMKECDGRIKTYFDEHLKAEMFKGTTWDEICLGIVDDLPQKIYLSLDIDGLQPSFCPNTGTPVPGGIDFDQLIYLVRKLVEAGKTIIGFDLCEVAGKPHEWDANVAARLLYRVGNLMLKSQKI